jgi:tetratricopeptide (TPR) repeat protein
MELLQKLWDWLPSDADGKIGIVLTFLIPVLGFVIARVFFRRNPAPVAASGVMVSKDLLDELIQRRVEEALARNGDAPAQPGEAAAIIKSAAAGVETVAEEGGEAGARALAEARASGDLTAVKTVLQKLAEAEAAKGRTANALAAERYRELGAIAFLTDTAEAMRAYARAAELDPDNWDGWWRLGQLQQRAGNLAAARASFERLLGLRNRIDNPYYIHWTLMLLGDVEAAEGNRASALRQYEAAQRLIQDLLANDPKNTEWLRDLSVSYNKIGDVRLQEGDAKGALQAYQDGLAIRKDLSQKDPKNAQWRTDLVVSYYKLATAGAPEACRYAREGLAIAQDMEAKGTLDKSQPYVAVMTGLVRDKCG